MMVCTEIHSVIYSLSLIPCIFLSWSYKTDSRPPEDKHSKWSATVFTVYIILSSIPERIILKALRDTSQRFASHTSKFTFVVSSGIFPLGEITSGTAEGQFPCDCESQERHE